MLAVIWWHLAIFIVFAVLALLAMQDAWRRLGQRARDAQRKEERG